MTARHIFMTGATGFLGKLMVPALLQAGHRLTLATRRDMPQTSAWRAHPDVTLRAVGDLESADCRDLMAGTDAVLHLAGFAHVGDAAIGDRTAPVYRSNASATASLAAAAADTDVKCFIHMSSILAVAPNATSLTIDDATSPAPASAYGHAKLDAEHHVAALAGKGVLAVSLRPPLIIGPNPKGNLQRLAKLAATGVPLPFASFRNRRSLVSTQMLATAVQAILMHGERTDLSGNYAIADADALSTGEIVAELRRGMGRKPRLFPMPPRLIETAGRITGRERLVAGLTGSLVVDASRFRQRFGVDPSVAIRQALRELGAGIRSA